MAVNFRKCKITGGVIIIQDRNQELINIKLNYSKSIS